MYDFMICFELFISKNRKKFCILIISTQASCIEKFEFKRRLQASEISSIGWYDAYCIYQTYTHGSRKKYFLCYCWYWYSGKIGKFFD